MCRAALFITVKTWKLCKCPLTDEWIKKSAVCVCVCVFAVKHYLAIKNKNEISQQCGWIQEIIILSGVSQTERQIIHHL